MAKLNELAFARFDLNPTLTQDHIVATEGKSRKPKKDPRLIVWYRKPISLRMLFFSTVSNSECASSLLSNTIQTSTSQ